jgi:hypothetical protein
MHRTAAATHEYRSARDARAPLPDRTVRESVHISFVPLTPRSRIWAAAAYEFFAAEALSRSQSSSDDELPHLTCTPPDVTE